MCNAVPSEAPDVTRIPEIKERFLELAGVMHLRAFVSGWFHDAPFEVSQCDGEDGIEDGAATGVAQQNCRVSDRGEDLVCCVSGRFHDAPFEVPPISKHRRIRLANMQGVENPATGL